MAKNIQFEWDDRNLRWQFKQLKRKYKNKAKVRKIARPASKIAVNHLRKGAIVRGDTAKKTPPSYFLPKKRKRKGETAIYHKGNARRSMRNFAFRKSYFMHVGAKVNQGAGAGGTFNSGNKVEGFYNYFLQYGTKKIRARRHMSKAIIAASGEVGSRLAKDMNQDLITTALATKR